MLPLLLGCAFAVRVEKSLVPPDYVTATLPAGELAAVSYVTGARGDAPAPYAPTAVELRGRRYFEVVEITSAGWIEVAPTGGPVDLRVYVRSNGLNQHDFTRVLSVTGGIDGAVPSEVRFLPDRIDAPTRLSMAPLTSAFNDFHLDHGDLLLVEVGQPDAPPERYLFKTYEFGPRFKYGGGILLTVPLAAVSARMPETTSAILAFTTSFGWRFRTRSPVLRWFGGNSALIVSTGVGTTALKPPSLDTPLEDQISAHFASIIAGGGLELYDFVSVQTLVNVSAVRGDLAQAPWVLSVGFDAVQFGLFTRDLGSRVFYKNGVEER